MALVGVAFLACACTTDPVQTRVFAPRTTTTSDPLAAVDTEVVDAWKSAEDAFFEAASEPDGYSSAQLDAFVGEALSTVVSNLALESFDGEIGEGSWNLGSPAVVSLGPTESSPTAAVVMSCIHDTQLLVDRASGEPVPGVLGTPDWAEATSQMVLTGPGSWKVATQTFQIDTDKEVACPAGS